MLYWETNTVIDRKAAKIMPRRGEEEDPARDLEQDSRRLD